MKASVNQIKRSMSVGLAMAGVVVLSGCAGVTPAANFQPGSATVAVVEQSMGKPSMTWRNSQGKIVQAAYSNQPGGWFTWMIKFNDQGVVTSVSQVMSDAGFAKIQNGMDGNQVHKILGPERSVDHFPALNQVDWNYGYCSDNDGRQVFAVSFDATTMRVNGSVTTPDPMYWMGDNEEARCEPYIK